MTNCAARPLPLNIIFGGPMMMHNGDQIDALVEQAQSRTNADFAESADATKERMIYAVGEICMTGALCK